MLRNKVNKLIIKAILRLILCLYFMLYFGLLFPDFDISKFLCRISWGSVDGATTLFLVISELLLSGILMGNITDTEQEWGGKPSLLTSSRLVTTRTLSLTFFFFPNSKILCLECRDILWKHLSMGIYVWHLSSEYLKVFCQ